MPNLTTAKATVSVWPWRNNFRWPCRISPTHPLLNLCRCTHTHNFALFVYLRSAYPKGSFYSQTQSVNNRSISYASKNGLTLFTERLAMFPQQFSFSLFPIVTEQEYLLACHVAWHKKNETIVFATPHSFPIFSVTRCFQARW